MSDDAFVDSDRFRIHPVIAQFEHPDTEAHYWITTTDEAAASTRTAATLAALGCVILSLADLMAVGAGREWSNLMAIRLGCLIPALVFIEFLERRPRLIRRHALVTAVESVLFAGYVAVGVRQPDIADVQHATIGLVVLGLFILVPNDIRLVSALNVAGVASWLVLSAGVDRPTSGALTMRALVLSCFLIMGFVAATRLAVTRREEFAARLLDRELSDRLEREVAWRRVIEAELTQRANVDVLTGLSTRRHLLDQGVEELRRAQRLGHGVSVLVIDVDHFKSVNDRYGHHVGDVVLATLAGLVRDGLRRIDSIGRLGGEEFAVIMPGADAARAVEVAERIRQRVAQQRLDVNDQQLSVTVSIGVAECVVEQDLLAEALDRADAAMYRAKQAGRNQVRTAPLPAPSDSMRSGTSR